MKNVLVRVGCCLVILLAACNLSATTKRENLNKYRVIDKKTKNCEDKLKDCYNALRNYADMHKGLLPSKNNYAGLKELLTYGVTNEDFRCRYYNGPKYDFEAERKAEEKRLKQLEKIAEDRKAGKTVDRKKLTVYTPKEKFSEKHSGYAFFGGINLSVAKNSVPKMVVMCDKISKFRNKNDHLSVLTVDGKVDTIKLEKAEKNNITSTVELINYLSKKYRYPQEVARALRNRAASIDAELEKLKSAEKKK